MVTVGTQHDQLLHSLFFQTGGNPVKAIFRIFPKPKLIDRFPAAVIDCPYPMLFHETFQIFRGLGIKCGKITSREKNRLFPSLPVIGEFIGAFLPQKTLIGSSVLTHLPHKDCHTRAVNILRAYRLTPAAQEAGICKLGPFRKPFQIDPILLKKTAAPCTCPAVDTAVSPIPCHQIFLCINISQCLPDADTKPCLFKLAESILKYGIRAIMRHVPDIVPGVFQSNQIITAVFRGVHYGVVFLKLPEGLSENIGRYLGNIRPSKQHTLISQRKNFRKGL